MRKLPLTERQFVYGLFAIGTVLAIVGVVVMIVFSPGFSEPLGMRSCSVLSQKMSAGSLVALNNCSRGRGAAVASPARMAEGVAASSNDILRIRQAWQVNKDMSQKRKAALSIRAIEF